jgi:hypothetical protein
LTLDKYFAHPLIECKRESLEVLDLKALSPFELYF